MGWQVLKNFTESFPTLNLPWNLAHFQMHTSYAHLSFETCSLSAYGTMPLATNTPTICTPVALRVLLMSLTDKLSYNILHTSNTHVYRPPYTVSYTLLHNKHADHLYTSGDVGTPHVTDWQVVIQHPTHITHTRIYIVYTVSYSLLNNKHADHLYTSGTAGTPHVTDWQVIRQHPIIC